MQIIQLENSTVEVKKLPLGKYADLLRALKKLPAQLSNFSGLSNDQLIASVPTILAEALPDFLDVFRVATSITDDQIDELGLDEAVDIFLAIIQENKFDKVYDKIKKAVAQFQTKPNPQPVMMTKTGSGQPSTSLPANTDGLANISSKKST